MANKAAVALHSPGRVVTDNPATTGSKQALTQFKPGQSGNPAGRQKGSRNKLAEDFVADMHAAWQQHGKQAIDAMIADKPGDFVKTVAQLMPKDVNFNFNDRSDLTDDELRERIAALAAQLAPFLPDGTGTAPATGDGKGRKAITSQVH